jgi:hypothetical protein
MNYEQDEQQFLEAMATRFGLANTRRLVFIQRLLEANADLNDTQLADVLNLTSHIVRDNLKTICDSLEIEGCDFGKQQKGRWKTAKKWLRFELYPAWKKQDRPVPSPTPLGLDWIWHSLQEKANPQPEWIRFVPADAYKGIIVPPARQSPQPQLKPKTPYLLHVDLQYPEWHLLLLNQGLDTKYVLSPSLAFAPGGQLTGKPMWMPQREAMCENITFDAMGKEEFLAIAVKEVPEFAWLVPRETEPAPVWDAVRLNQLWSWLQQQGNWQVFYQVFEVAE